jgi:hypothetical protein
MAAGGDPPAADFFVAKILLRERDWLHRIATNLWTATRQRVERNETAIGADRDSEWIEAEQVARECDKLGL